MTEEAEGLRFTDWTFPNHRQWLKEKTKGMKTNFASLQGERRERYVLKFYTTTEEKGTGSIRRDQLKELNKEDDMMAQLKLSGDGIWYIDDWDFIWSAVHMIFGIDTALEWEDDIVICSIGSNYWPK